MYFLAMSWKHQTPTIYINFPIRCLNFGGNNSKLNQGKENNRRRVEGFKKLFFSYSRQREINKLETIKQTKPSKHAIYK